MDSCIECNHETHEPDDCFSCDEMAQHGEHAPCASVDREPLPDPVRPQTIEAISAAIEALEALATEISRETGLEHFKAYHLASLEGDRNGWLGGPHLIDALHEIVEEQSRVAEASVR